MPTALHLSTCPQAVSLYGECICGATSIRSEAETRRDWLESDDLSRKLARWKREDAEKERCLANATFYLVWLRPTKGETKPWQPEWPLMSTEADVLECIEDHDRYPVQCVLRIDPGCAPVEVSEDIAILAKDKWLADGHDIETDPLPSFVMDHLPTSEDSGYRGPYNRQ
jgi:hypothetical protein